MWWLISHTLQWLPSESSIQIRWLDETNELQTHERSHCRFASYLQNLGGSFLASLWPAASACGHNPSAHSPNTQFFLCELLLHPKVKGEKGEKRPPPDLLAFSLGIKGGGAISNLRESWAPGGKRGGGQGLLGRCKPGSQHGMKCRWDRAGKLRRLYTGLFPLMVSKKVQPSQFFFFSP